MTEERLGHIYILTFLLVATILNLWILMVIGIGALTGYLGYYYTMVNRETKEVE